MKLKIHSAGGAGSLEVAESTYGARYNESLIHQVVTAYQSGARSGTKGQKDRSTTRGGGAKPYRQKGTGRARAGTIRSPIWVGGGRAFAARPRDHSQKVNRKMYRGAVRSILSELIRQERLLLAKEFALEEPRTKLLAARLKAFDAEDVLIVIEGYDRNIYLAARNIPHVEALDVPNLDPVTLIRHEKVLMTVGAAKLLEERLA